MPLFETNRLLRRVRPWRKIIGSASLLFLVAGAIAVISPSPAQAFDCGGAEQCPFVKIENIRQLLNERVYYEVWGSLVGSDGQVLHEWHEKETEYTLWHWRNYGSDGTVKIHVHAWSALASQRFSADNDFQFSASDSFCIKVDQAGAYQSGGCTDSEDPAR